MLAVDANDMDAFEAEFTEDCVMTRGEHRVVGRDTIMRLMRQRSPNRVTRHLVGQVLVELVDEGEATAISYFTLYEGDRSEGEMPYSLREPAAVGEYRDVFRLTDGGWRIAERHITPVFVRKEQQS
jgi:ketosteroid isomerase-like protein